MHEQRWSLPHYLGFGLYHDLITWFLALFAFSTSSPRSCSLSSRALRSAVNFSLSDCALDTSTLAWISSVLAESRSDSSRFTCFSVFSFSNYKVTESYRTSKLHNIHLTNSSTKEAWLMYNESEYRKLNLFFQMEMFFFQIKMFA